MSSRISAYLIHSHTYIVITPLDNDYSKLLLGGNPLLEGIKVILKDGGVKRLFGAMRDPKFDPSNTM